MTSPEEVLRKAIATKLRERASRHPLIIGICGSQGSGKSTLSAALAARFERAVTFSLDDLYLGHAAREELARRVHPLLATRGVPGTHDPILGIEVLGALASGAAVALPRFDKATDDRLPKNEWPIAQAGCELVIFEGWCVGARPQEAKDLLEPVNRLEAEEDRDGRWRTFVNEALAGSYQQLFRAIDMLVLLAPPDWDTVVRWRTQQEHELRATSPEGTHIMDDDAIVRFVSHFERLTKHILAEMPPRADLALYLNNNRECVRIKTPLMPSGSA